MDAWVSVGCQYHSQFLRLELYYINKLFLKIDFTSCIFFFACSEKLRVRLMGIIHAEVGPIRSDNDGKCCTNPQR